MNIRDNIYVRNIHTAFLTCYPSHCETFALYYINRDFNLFIYPRKKKKISRNFSKQIRRKIGLATFRLD